MMGDLWPAIWLSLRIAAVATAACAAVAVPLAFLFRRRRFPGQSLVEALILLPMVLPPTVVGYLLLVMFGGRGWLTPLIGGHSLIYTFEGAAVAAAVVA